MWGLGELASFSLRGNNSDVDRGQTPEDEAEDEDKTPRTRTRPRTLFLVLEDIHIVSNYTRQSSHACMPHTKKIIIESSLQTFFANSHPGKSDGCK